MPSRFATRVDWRAWLSVPCGFNNRLLKLRCDFFRATTYIEPKTSLPLCIGKGAVCSRTELIIAAVRLRKNILHERAMKVIRDLSSPQHVTHHPLMSHLSVLETQGMPWQSCRPQELAQPLSIP
jgi:hypothetical protein